MSIAQSLTATVSVIFTGNVEKLYKDKIFIKRDGERGRGERGIETDRPNDRDTERQRDRETQTKRETDSEKPRQTERQSDRQTDSETERETVRQT